MPQSQKHAISMVKSFMTPADIHEMRWQFHLSVLGKGEHAQPIVVLPGLTPHPPH